MSAPDLIPTLKRVADMAHEIDMTARRPDGVYPAASEAILEELTGASPSHQWRYSIGPEAASVVCLAKSIRVLASMLAAREGVTIPIAGILDDMTAGSEPDPRDGESRRSCLDCGRPFASAGAASRLCAECTSPDTDDDLRLPSSGTKVPD